MKRRRHRQGKNMRENIRKGYIFNKKKAIKKVKSASSEIKEKKII